MNKLILKSTETNSTTIIPNFGAIMKMGKTFMYNEFLKYDDGKLAQLVAAEKGIDEAEAKSQIANWVDQLVKDLDAGKTVVFDGVGELTKPDGKMKFVAKPGASGATETVPPVTKEEKPVLETPKPEVKKEEKPAVETPKPEVKVEKVKKQKTSADYKAKEAVEKVGKFKDKNELIAFTRGEERKTVVAALNAKLDELNGKKKEVVKEEPKTTEVQAPKNVVTEVELPKEEPVKPIVEEKKEEKVVPPVIEEKKEEKPNVAPAPSVEKPEVKVEPKEEPIKEPAKTVKEKAAEIEKPVENKEEEEAAIAAIVNGVAKTEKETGKRKKRWILWVGLLLILIGGGTFGYLKKDMIMGWFDKTHEPKDLAEGHEDDEHTNDQEHQDEESHSNEENNTVADEHSNNETVETDHTEETPVDESTQVEVVEEVVEEPVVEEPVVEETPVVNSSSDGNWHIVAGCFSSKSNAENLVSELQSQGYSSAKVLGKYNGLYTVRASSHNSKEEAKSALSDFTSSGNAGFIKNL